MNTAQRKRTMHLKWFKSYQLPPLFVKNLISIWKYKVFYCWNWWQLLGMNELIYFYRNCLLSSHFSQVWLSEMDVHSTMVSHAMHCFDFINYSSIITRLILLVRFIYSSQSSSCFLKYIQRYIIIMWIDKPTQKNNTQSLDLWGRWFFKKVTNEIWMEESPVSYFIYFNIFVKLSFEFFYFFF